MERLTIYTGSYYESINPVDLALDEYSDINFERLVDKLAEYEDAEEQGLLLRLPCKVGDTLYQQRKDGMYEYKFIGLVHNIANGKWDCEVAVQIGLKWIKTVCSMECIGKTVFLTREEAEQALKQMGE